MGLTLCEITPLYLKYPAAREMDQNNCFVHKAESSHTSHRHEAVLFSAHSPFRGRTSYFVLLTTAGFLVSLFSFMQNLLQCLAKIFKAVNFVTLPQQASMDLYEN
ncbi:hypothetical protein AMECASPLE_024166 [Ameca splendens]|uniref:Uncharacterized protein n=1 Tax=Ameca splendens TaxID=208324 RepID=A0ABV1A0H8_9TELE